MCIARSSTPKNVHRRRRGSWQTSSMSLSSAVPAWFTVSGHDLLQTAGLRSCSAIASRTDPVLGLRAREVQCRSASSCPCIAFAVHRGNLYLPPIHCRKWPLVITHAQHMASPAKLSRNQERLDASYVTDLQDLGVWLLFVPSGVCQASEATHVDTCRDIQPMFLTHKGVQSGWLPCRLTLRHQAGSRGHPIIGVWSGKPAKRVTDFTLCVTFYDIN